MASDRTYGARRVWHDMLAEGFACGLHRIERLMQLQALRARPRRRRLPKDEGDRQMPGVASNILDRQFEAERPNQKWIADFTYIWTAEGWLYVSAVIDLFSRRVVGWSMSATMTARLVADALLMAVWRRGKPRELLHHSDQGSQYSSEQFQRLMADSGIVCSMSRSGNVWDNAAMESFFSSLKTEQTARKPTAPGTRPEQMCSTTSSGSTTRPGVIRQQLKEASHSFTREAVANCSILSSNSSFFGPCRRRATYRSNRVFSAAIRSSTVCGRRCMIQPRAMS